MKKEFQWSLFLGCVLIAASILAAGFLLSRSILEVGNTLENAAFLTPEEAAAFCRIDVEDLEAFRDCPDLTAKIGGKTVYWKSVLEECMRAQFVGE